MRNGVPATLATFPAKGSQSTQPLLTPYPSWESNLQGDCGAIQNVENVEIDDKGQIWIVDGGHTNTLLPHPERKCPPKLLIIDIEGNKTITTYEFPPEVASSNGSFLYDFVVDGDYAYISDNSGMDPGM